MSFVAGIRSILWYLLHQEHGKGLLRALHPEASLEEMYGVLSDKSDPPLVVETGTRTCEDWISHSRNSGCDIDFEKRAQRIYVDPLVSKNGEVFGTRCQHVLAVRDDNHVLFTENFHNDDGRWVKSEYRLDEFGNKEI